MEPLEDRIRYALRHHVERSPIDDQAPPIDEVFAGRARDVPISAGSPSRPRRLLTAAALLIVVATAGLAIFASRRTTNGRTEISSPEPDTYAAVLGSHDAHLIDSSMIVGGSGPRRHLTVYASRDPARAIVVSDGSTSSASSLDYYTGNNTFRPDASTPVEVNGTTVALAEPSGDTGGLWLALWNHGASTTHVAGRNTTRSEVMAIITALTADPSGAGMNRALPAGFQELYDGQDNNPFLAIRPPGTVATYRTPSNGRFALSYQRLGRADPNTLVWALPQAKLKTIDGHQAIVERAKSTTIVHEFSGSTMTSLSLPETEAAELLTKVRYVDHPSWTAHTKTALRPGTVYQTASTTVPGGSPGTTVAQPLTGKLVDGRPFTLRHDPVHGLCLEIGGTNLGCDDVGPVLPAGADPTTARHAIDPVAPFEEVLAYGYLPTDAAGVVAQLPTGRRTAGLVGGQPRIWAIPLPKGIDPSRSVPTIFYKHQDGTQVQAPKVN
jgi:hypothetical protein